MTATLIANKTVDVDSEGFLTDPSQWNDELAEEIAQYRDKMLQANMPQTVEDILSAAQSSRNWSSRRL